MPALTRSGAGHRLGARSLAALLPAVEELGAPRYRSLAESVLSLLLDGRIAPNVTLPSERELASALGLSRSTTTAAYQRLADQGVLIKRQGSGSLLRLPPGSRVAGPGARVRRGDAAMIDLSVAAIPAEPGWLTEAAIEAAGQLRHYLGRLGYEPYGLYELRELVAERYRARGVPTTAEQILITNGAQHGTDLALRLLLAPGERVLTELPCYPGALDCVRAGGGRVLGVPFAAGGGWDVSSMTATLRQAAPRLAILIPDFNNPTGALIPTGQRSAVLAAARQSGTRVLVDESFVDLDLRDRPAEPAAPMAALDGGVLSVGSVSKPIWGGVRVGWIRAEQDLISELAVVRARSDMSGSVLDQLIALRILGDCESLLATRRAELRVQRDALLAAVQQRLPAWRPSIPDGGLSSWIRLDSPAATALTRLAEERGVLITPGSRFAVGASLERYLRLPYTLPPPVLAEAVERLARCWQAVDRNPAGATRPAAPLIPA
jgi:DNA-binding transcriptional MocR family regulator